MLRHRVRCVDDPACLHSGAVNDRVGNPFVLGAGEPGVIEAHVDGIIALFQIEFVGQASFGRAVHIT
ncbi:hypothetical protein D3C76_1543540 [compost metagenome]